MTKTEKPFGTWDSPISAELIVQDAKRLGQVLTDGRDIYWFEGRPSEGGRNVIMRQCQDKMEEILPAPYNARTRVHEYGGANLIVSNGKIFFSNNEDQKLYRLDGEIKPIAEGYRFADGVYDEKRQKIYSVAEKHGDDVINCLVSIDVESGKVTPIAEGWDFYASPRLSPDCSRLTWFAWNQPNMPWDSSEVFLGTLSDDGTLETQEKVAGGENISVAAPSFSPEGDLYFVSDESGYWNLYRYRGEIEAIHKMEADFATPHWCFGVNPYTFFEGHIMCTYTIKGTDYLAMIDPETHDFNPINLPYTVIRDLHSAQDKLVFLGGTPTEPSAVVTLDFNTLKLNRLREAASVNIDRKYFSQPETIEFPTENNKTAFCFYYPPTNPDFEPPENTAPPLVMRCHGGPTGHTVSSFNMVVQYWTSRGFAYCDLNYGGSTGFGREYRERLKDNWGIVDVDDACNAANYLVEVGKADPRYLAIAGGSAGGYTALAALTFRDTFSAGASYYGVSDLGMLAQDTHKFEARYLDGLIGPYPERKDLYDARSPANHTDKLSCPIILLQGDGDKVVPPSQSELMYKALQEKGIETEYLLFEGEQHGFRGSDAIKRSLEAELNFYRKIFELHC
ncbi:MAG: S9 family peptidase [Simkaniaceae bacterium]|nr:S9 family peptidase [Simkaniaceae bacterium]